MQNWNRNTPDAVRTFTAHHYRDHPLFANQGDQLLDALILERVVSANESDFDTWKTAPAAAARLLWEARTERVKLSDFAEEFFRRLADKLGHAMLLRKGGLHQLLDFVEPKSLPSEVAMKLDLLKALFDRAHPVVS